MRKGYSAVGSISNLRSDFYELLQLHLELESQSSLILLVEIIVCHVAADSSNVVLMQLSFVTPCHHIVIFIVLLTRLIKSDEIWYLFI